MATSAYLKLVDYQNKQLMSTSQVKGHENEIELVNWEGRVEQTLNIGSQSSGAGAGKVTFNPLKIVKYVDKTSPVLFSNCCSGTPYKDAILTLTQPMGKDNQTAPFLVLNFKLVAIKSITYGDADNPTEAIEFEYGGLLITYVPHGADGKPLPSVVNGWNRVRNVALSDVNAVLS